MSDISGAIERIYRRILLVIGRGRIKTGNDDGPVQFQQVRLGVLETIDNLPRLAEYGFNSMPPAETDAIVLFMGGNRSQGVIVATGSQQFRMRSLKPGEVSISDNKGQSVHLTQEGIVVDGGGLPILVKNTPSVTLDTPDVTMTGDLHVKGSVDVEMNIVAKGDISDQGEKSMRGMREVYNGHAHDVTGVRAGGDTVKSKESEQKQ